MLSNWPRLYNSPMLEKEIPESELGYFPTLVGIVERLRAPGGCPWDREQTHASLKRNLLEECYEVLEAIAYSDHLQARVDRLDDHRRDRAVDAG